MLGCNHTDMEKGMFPLQQFFNLFKFTGKYSNLFNFVQKQSNEKALPGIISKYLDLAPQRAKLSS